MVRVSPHFSSSRGIPRDREMFSLKGWVWSAIFKMARVSLHFTSSLLGLHCEVWEDSENVLHANKIEEALELHGLQYISTPRKQKRGGGAAITLIKDSPFILIKLTPQLKPEEENLEVCWGLLKLKQPTSQIKSIIVCSFYLPPRSRKKSVLVNLICLIYFILKSTYPNSAIILGGDKNDLNLQRLLDKFQTACDPTNSWSVYPLCPYN